MFWLSSVESESGSEDDEIPFHDMLNNGAIVINVSTQKLLRNNYQKLPPAAN